ncbi:MAG: hypothetical protein GXX78_04725 [Bacteroidales bacterium]|nr:hypothetical protein [Bacteroidales bacterium]
MKNKKLIFAVLFAGILALNTLVLSTTNNNDLQLNSLFTLASAQAEDGEDGENSNSPYNCIGKITEERTIYNEGNYSGADCCIAYNYKCDGSNGPCCEGWVKCWYVVEPGETTPPEYTEDYRNHTRCENVNK